MQLSDHIINDLKLKMLNVCDNDVECNLIDFDPECRSDPPSSKNFEDNLIRRRRRSDSSIFRDNKMTFKKLKRIAKSSADRDSVKPERKRERVEIRFKFIGKN